MSNKPANQIMSQAEMLEMNEGKKLTRLYSKTEDASDKVSALIGNLSDELAAMPERISLGDTELVKRIAAQYVDSCKISGCIPSKIALCRALGVSRQAVDNYMSRNPEHQTSRFLEIVFDSFAEILSNSALVGAAQPIVAIFVEKAVYKWRDVLTVEAPQPQNPLGETADPAALAEKYSYLLED